MNYWRSPAFYGLLFVGYLVTLMFIAALCVVFGGDDISVADAWILNIGMHLLSLLAGYSFARTKLRKRAVGRGFPVVVTPPNDSQTERK